MKSNRFTLIFLSVLSIAAAGLVVAIFWPFLKPLLFAAILGIGLYPLQSYLLRYIHSRSAAAMFSTLAVLIIIVLPAAVTITAVSSEMANAAHLLAEKSREQGGVQQYVTNVVQKPLNWIGRHVDLEKTGIQQWLDSLPSRASGILLRSATFLVSRLAGFAGQTIITFFVLFFIFRDGPAISDKIAGLLPLSDDQTQRLFMEKEEIVYKQYIHIGVAVDTDRGLLVPVIRDVDRKNIVELASELSQLSKKAKDKKLTPDEMEGGTFTITNLGGIGGTAFTPIVNHPEVAILGLSRGRMLHHRFRRLCQSRFRSQVRQSPPRPKALQLQVFRWHRACRPSRKCLCRL